MAVPTSANYVFLPWVRQGAASGIQTPDSLGSNQAGVALATVKLQINNTDDIDRQVRLYGPGDITGIDPQQVIRTEPRHLATDFEPNYFPAIEFDRPDFPWLFTPAKANDEGRLRPWLCLVVVRKREGAMLRADRNLPLPVLEIDARELPDLSESWAWAHAQVTGSRRESSSIERSLAGDPALTVSRLLCPRRLDPLTEYLACLVPAFELGRKAGLGEPITTADEQPPLGLAPAWVVGPQPPPQVKLPVYFHWEFRTGAGGDFEALVGLLAPRKMPEEVGKRPVDISQPMFRITPPLPPGTTLELEGALRALDSRTAEWPKETRVPFQTELKKILDAPWEAMKHEGKEPLLAPPIYGCWQAGRHTVEMAPAPSTSTTSPTTWIDELNLDPRHRAVAALGTQIVQAQQEQLMASAWEQLGEIERINQMLRQAQLGRAVNAVYHAKHFTRFSEETLLKVVAIAQSRTVVNATDANNVKTRAMLSHRISQTAIPARAVSAPLRRMTSPRNAISTRFRAVGAPPIAIVAKLNTTTILQFQKQEAGLVTINQVSDDQTSAVANALKQVARFENVTNALDTSPQLGDFKIVAEGATLKRSLLNFTPGSTDSPEARAFRDAAKAHQKYLVQNAFISFLIFPAPPMDLSDTKTNLLESVNPEKTINARVRASLKTAGGARSDADPLEPILDAPDFPQPMYEALRDLSQDFLFPGLEHVPPNTVTLLETNPKFVESFLVGLNAELSRELLWRNYPTDQRSTFFRQFWDTSADTAQPDIEPIDKWGDRNLGQNIPRISGKLVLLLRGELLRRYPNSVIYAVAAVRKDGQLDLSPKPEDERHPLFRGTLKPDVTFLGFDLKREDAIADPGWFFVIQQQPTEPRFGMDVANFEKPLPPLTTWNDLSWRHLVKTEDEFKALSHASIKTVLPDIDKAKWGRNSAHQAYITLQRPVRVAIHAREMIMQG
jgi:hypothetical protein